MPSDLCPQCGGVPYGDRPCETCGGQPAPSAKKRVRKQVVKQARHTVEIQKKTYEMLREYCRLNNSQIRSEIDGLLQFAIEQRLKVPT